MVEIKHNPLAQSTSRKFWIQDTHTYAHTHTHKCTHTHTHKCTHTYTHTCMHARAHAHTQSHQLTPSLPRNLCCWCSSFPKGSCKQVTANHSHFLELSLSWECTEFQHDVPWHLSSRWEHFTRDMLWHHKGRKGLTWAHTNLSQECGWCQGCWRQFHCFVTGIFWTAGSQWRVSGSGSKWTCCSVVKEYHHAMPMVFVWHVFKWSHAL